MDKGTYLIEPSETHPGFMLPPLMFSEEEIEALVLGSRDDKDKPRALTNPLPGKKARHPRWSFHFTPTSASWLNAVEGFFAKRPAVSRQEPAMLAIQEQSSVAQ